MSEGHLHRWSEGVGLSGGRITKRFCTVCKHWIVLDVPEDIETRVVPDATQRATAVEDASHDDDTPT